MMIYRKFFSIFFISIQLSITVGCAGNNDGTEKNVSQFTSSDSSTPEVEGVEDSVSLPTQSKKSEEELFIFRKNGKDGFVNLKGEWIIQPKYESAYPFIEGLAVVILEGKYLLIDKKEQPIPLPNGVTELSSFKEGLAAVTIGGKTGFINRSGKLVVKPSIDIPASSMALPSEGLRMIVLDSLFTFIDSTGKIIRQPGFEYALDFFEGLALVSSKGKYGYINASGAIAIPLKYDLAWSFSEGLALVGTAVGEDIKLYFINRSGKTVIAVPYKMVNPRFTDGMTFFGIETEGKRKFGFMDRNGKVVIDPTFDKVEEIASSTSRDFGKVLAFKVKSGDLWGLITKDISVKPAFSDIAPFHEGLAVASTGTGDKQKFGFIDKKGKWVIQPEFDAANDFSNGLAAVRTGPLIGGNWGYLNGKGKLVIEPQFRFAYNFQGEIAMVQKDNKKAIINKTGMVLIEE